MVDVHDRRLSHGTPLRTVLAMGITGRLAVVTGANQGLGFAVAEGLARRLDERDVVLLTGRDRGRVHEAAGRVREARASVHPDVLDVRDTAAVHAFADRLRAEHGGVDLVFSNAAARLAPNTPWAEIVGPFVDTNNLGTTRVLRALHPLLRRGGRMLVVASSFGTLYHLPEHLHARFAAHTLDAVDEVMIDWRDAVLAGRAAREGWPEWINIPSKVGQVAAVRALARERAASRRDDATLVAAVCPGLVDTDASRPWFADMSRAQTPRQAAVALLDLALGRDVDRRVEGQLVRFGSVLPWT
jgi:carbonyl reductase 1